jgi:hypothetical protein
MAGWDPKSLDLQIQDQKTTGLLEMKIHSQDLGEK